MPDQLGRDEFYRALADFRTDLKGAFAEGKADVKEDLSAIRDHLATLNGRTLKGEIERENHRTRITSLEKTVYAKPKERESSELLPAFTKREYRLMALGLGIIFAIIRLVEFLGSKAWVVLSKP